MKLLILNYLFYNPYVKSLYIQSPKLRVCAKCMPYNTNTTLLVPNGVLVSLLYFMSTRHTAFIFILEFTSELHIKLVTSWACPNSLLTFSNAFHAIVPKLCEPFCKGSYSDDYFSGTN